MENISIKDHLNFLTNKKYKKVIGKNDKLLWSGTCLKINKKQKR